MRHLDATRSAAAAAAATHDQSLAIRIAGVGLLTPLGVSAATTWDALLRGEYITTHSRVPIDFPESDTRVTALAVRAAREALDSADWNPRTHDPARTALVIGTSKGPVESWLAPPLHMELMPYMVGGPDPTGIAHIAATIGHEFHLIGPRLTLSAACASGLHALIRAALMLRSGEADRALVVAAESSLHPLFQATFKRLGVLAPPETGCRPFDQSRDGFLMSESAAAVCLERSSGALAPLGDHAWDHQVFVEDFALGGDATHLTGSDPQGTTLRRLLKRVIAGRAVDLFHAHGTGTPANDGLELTALEDSVPPGCSPLLYSHKGALGHSLGAAGLVSVVINSLCHRTGAVPRVARTQTPLPTRTVTFCTAKMQVPVRRSIAIASGFGGSVAVVGLYGAQA